jgi:acyl-CoA reductase-like NAD-dependent aldehyde dehydrogenase
VAVPRQRRPVPSRGPGNRRGHHPRPGRRDRGGERRRRGGPPRVPDRRWHPPAERAALLLEAADVLAEHADELALLESRENGKPVADARSNDINFLIGVFRFFGSLVDKLPTDFYDKGAIYTSTYLEPLTVMRIVELLNTVLPEDVLHAVPGSGRNVGQAPRRPPAGAHGVFHRLNRGRGSGRRHRRQEHHALELGGKDALIVFDDADLGRAVKDTLEGAFYNKGEACTASSRILVQDGLYDVFVEQLATAVTKLKVGRGTDPGVHVGPVVTKTQQQRALNYIQAGIDEGARIAAQAALPAGPELANGYWVAPTVFADVTHSMRIARQEMFGPVVTITRISGEDEAVEIANESQYGLTCAVYTSDSARAFRVARRHRRRDGAHQ